MKTTAVIVAGGNSKRFGGETPKQYLSLCGMPLLSRTIEKFEKCSSVDDIVIVAAEEYMAMIADEIVDPFGFHKVSKIVPGGESRSRSVFNGLEAVNNKQGLVAIHDAARPLVSSDDIDRVVKTAVQFKAAILAVPVSDTVKKGNDDMIESTIDRKSLWNAQTPQVFEFDLIYNAYREVIENGTIDSFTDDASLLENRNINIKLVEPSSYNFKITTSEDFSLAELLLERDNNGRI